MFKRKIVKFAAAAVTALAAVGGCVISAAGPAAANSYTCNYSSPGHATSCKAFTLFATRLWLADNTAYGYMPKGTEVEVTCWYYGNSGDGYWDHSPWDSWFGNVTGHVNDNAIDFGGQTPNQVGLSQC